METDAADPAIPNLSVNPWLRNGVGGGASSTTNNGLTPSGCPRMAFGNLTERAHEQRAQFEGLRGFREGHGVRWEERRNGRELDESVNNQAWALRSVALRAREFLTTDWTDGNGCNGSG